MKIDVIEQFEAFDALKANWEAVYAADPEANLFLSWGWMSKWLPQIKSQWLILAARPTGNAKDYVAFFPLRGNTRPIKNGGFYTNIAMAGRYFADYTGFICVPRWAGAAVPAFAETLKSMKWATVDFEYVRVSDKNMNRLLNCFKNKAFEMRWKSTVDPVTGIDLTICPHIELPGDWDAYLGTLSANWRQKLRRLLRQVDGDPELRITHVCAVTLDRDVESLLDLWGRQWSERKKDRAKPIQQNLREMLKHCFDLGVLFMPILWKGDKAVGALASLIDAQTKTLLFAVGARDKTFCKPQPGLTLHAHSIQHVINMGITHYDFLRGNEDYKYSFGARDRRIMDVVVRLKPNAGKKSIESILDVRSIPKALTYIRRQHKAGNFAAAEVGYRQVLSTYAKCAPALLGYGQLKLARGHAVAAQKLFGALIATKQISDWAHLGLGQSHAAQHRWVEARAYFQRAIELNPGLIQAHYYLGLAQERNGEHKEAICSYQEVIARQPDFRDAKVRLGKVMLRKQGGGSASLHV